MLALTWRFYVLLGILLLLFAALWFMTRMPGRSFQGPLPPLTEQEKEGARRLKEDVVTLAGRIGERNVWTPKALAAAAAHIEKTLKGLGYPTARQGYEVRLPKAKVFNIEAILTGAKTPDEIVVVGAHYDSVGGCPAANDNGSGVAALLEIARWFKGRKPARTIRFVAFVNEEPPFFQGPEMGSVVYARRCRQRGEKVVAMIALETMGYYSDVPGSQRYPLPLKLFYPDKGNFIGFVGNVKSRSLVHRCLASFRRHTKFPSEGAALPGVVPGVGWSDHWSFWQEGYEAVMVTDTAPYRYAHYHEHTDTPDKIDYERLARVVAGVARVVDELAGAG